LDPFGQRVVLSSLAAESISALSRIAWRLEPAARPVHVPASVAASRAAARSVAAAVGEAQIIDLIDSDADDDEDTQMQPADAAGAATASSAAAGSGTPTAARNSARQLVPPQLVIHTPQVNLAESLLEFAPIEVVPSSAGDSGRYSLTVHLPSPFSTRYSACVSFTFTNDVEELQLHQQQAQIRAIELEAKQLKHEEVLQRLVDTQASMQRLKEQQEKLDDNQRTLIRDVARECQQLTDVSLLPPALTPDRECLAKLQRWLRATFEALAPQISEASSSDAIAARLPRFLSTPGAPMSRLRKSDGFHGVVAQLAYVEEFRLAALVSWHLEGSLAHLITSDRECLADRELRQYCRQQHVGGVIDLAGVNPCDLQENTPLPHQRIRHLPGAVQGNPRYLLNCLRFNTTVEHERQKYRALFHSLASGVLIMDSMAAASDYRRLLVANRIRAPGILVLKELKYLSANNLERFDDRATAPGLDRLSAHLEVRGPSDGRRALMQRQVQALKSVSSALRDLERHQATINMARDQLRFDERTRADAALLAKLQDEVARLSADIRRLQPAVQAAGGGDAARLAQTNDQYMQDSRRERTARLLAMQQDAAAAAAPSAAPSAAGQQRFFSSSVAPPAHHAPPARR